MYKCCEHFVRVDKESAEMYEAKQDKWELGFESPGQPKKSEYWYAVQHITKLLIAVILANVNLGVKANFCSF